MMSTGPILARELVTSARNSRIFRRRAGLAICVLLAIGFNYLLWSIMFTGDYTIAGVSTFTRSMFAGIVVIQVLLTLVFIPAMVGRSIADERERSTLDEVLMTRLSSFEIVTGKLAAGLVQYASCLATLLPITIILPVLGGVDPRLVLLAFAGTASTAFFLASLSILLSTGAARGAQAFRGSFGLGAVWLLVPLVAELMLPFTYRSIYVWVQPVNAWLLASSPAVFLSGIVRWPGPGWLPRTAAWMIGLQLVAGAFLIGWAVARLRAASRGLKGGDGKLLGVRKPQLRWRAWPRPACGDNPVLWREMFATGPVGPSRIASTLVYLALFALGGYVTYRFGYSLIAERFSGRFDPFAVNAERFQFNEGLRQVTSWGEFFLLLTVAGIAAEGVAGEKTRETWMGLIATPLSGRSILHAKMIGAIWRVRWLMAPLILLWVVGILAGAIHPLGFLLAFAGLATAVWFFAAFGTYMSLISRDSAQASTRTLIVTLALLACFLLGLVPFRPTMILLGAGSMPFVNYFALIMHSDLRSALHNMTFTSPGQGRIPHGELTIRLIAVWVLAVGGHALGAVLWTRAAIARFDGAVGRPRKGTRPDEAPRTPSEAVASAPSLVLSTPR